MLIHCLVFLQDNVFVTVVASIQYRALADKASDAFYKLSNTREQIQAYVFDGILWSSFVQYFIRNLISCGFYCDGPFPPPTTAWWVVL